MYVYKLKRNKKKDLKEILNDCGKCVLIPQMISILFFFLHTSPCSFVREACDFQFNVLKQSRLAGFLYFV